MTCERVAAPVRAPVLAAPRRSDCGTGDEPNARAEPGRDRTNYCSGEWPIQDLRWLAHAEWW